MANNTVRHINIIGHQNPDTDSICSALAYAWLKNRGSLTGLYEARRAGHVNRETRFVLQHFGVEPPRLCTDVSPQIKDIDIRKQAGIDGEMSLRAAWNLMRDVEIDTLCIVDSDNELQGLITIKDIADANMDLFDTAVLAAANTRCTNLLETLEAELVVGSADAHIDSGNICIGTSPEIMEELVKPGDLVLVSNRYETQMCAIDCGAQAIVVCCGSAVPRTIVARAQEKGCAVLATPYDTYAAARLISTAAPVRHFMRTKELLKFSVNTPIEDAKKVMASVRHRYFPILDENGKYCGVVSRRNLLNLHRKQVILVDHNERTQAVDGLEQADILEIIDHHRIGSLETTGPVYFRNVPVGCTATILYQMYGEQGLTPSREIAGLLLSAILSDTLVFRSPTSTPQDEAAAKALAALAGEDIQSYAEQMFEAGADLTGRTAEDVFSSDFKAFSRGDVKFGVGQSTYMTDKSRAAAEALVQPFLPEASRREGLPLIFYMFTDMKTQSTDLMFYGHNAEDIIRDAFSEGEKKLVVLISRSSYSAEDMAAAVTRVYREDPALVPKEPLASVNMYSGTGAQRLYEISINYGMTSDELDARTAQLQAVDAFAELDTSGMSEAELAYAACEYLMEHCTVSEDKSENTAYAALVGGRANSEGTALAYIVLCRELGVDCRIVYGQEDWIEHCWNIVRIDGSYYHVDITAAIEDGAEAGFLMNDEMAWGHYRWDVSSYPKCSGELRYSDLLFDE